MVLSCPWEEALAAASQEVLWLVREQVLPAVSVPIVALVGIPVLKALCSCARGTAVGTAPAKTISAGQWPPCPTSSREASP